MDFYASIIEEWKFTIQEKRLYRLHKICCHRKSMYVHVLIILTQLPARLITVFDLFYCVAFWKGVSFISEWNEIEWNTC